MVGGGGSGGGGGMWRCCYSLSSIEKRDPRLGLS